MLPTLKKISFRCPECASPLEESGEELRCATCAFRCDVVDDIVLLDRQRDGAGLSAGELRSLLAEETITPCCREMLQRRGVPLDGELKMINEPNLASWTSLLPVAPGGRVLEIGAGLGAVTYTLALNFAEVYALVHDIGEALITRLRMRQQGLGNVRIIVTAGGEIPFFAESFDLITPNGVMDRSGRWPEAASGAPHSVEPGRLRELLRPGGTLLVHAENRYSLARMRGIRAGGRRPASGTMRGYRRLLAAAGFDQLYFFTPLPDGRSPLEIFPLESGRAFTYFLLKKTGTESHHTSVRYWIKTVLTRSGLMRRLSSEFLVLARRPESVEAPPASPAVEAGIPEFIAARVSPEHDALHFYLRTHARVNKHTLQIFNNSGRAPIAIAKVVSLRQHDDSHLTRESKNLMALGRLCADDPLIRSAIARVIATGRNGANYISLETFLDGVSLYTLLIRKDHSRRIGRVTTLFDPAVEWLLHFQSACRTRMGIDEEFALFPSLSGGPDSAVDSGLKELTMLAGAADSRRYDPFLQHGDFSPINILMTGDGIHVIDWEGLMRGYPPLFDLFCLFSPALFAQNRGDIARDLDRFETLFFSANPLTEYFNDKVQLYCTRLGVEKELLPLHFYDFLRIKYLRNSERKDARMTQLFRMFLNHYDGNYRRFYFHLFR